jgi:dUTP pyrophosphatase
MNPNNISDRIKVMANMVEKFVENNFMEKEHRDENFKKLALAFETFLKDNPFRQGISRVSAAVGTVQLKVKKLENFKGELPQYQSAGASGMDVRAQINENIVVGPGARVLVPTGLSMAVPLGYEIQARPRSGYAIRDGMTLLNTPGTIDADYRGEIKIILINLGDKEVVIKDQDRIAQLVICPVIQAEIKLVDSLDDTERGAGGFGSTGR